jgi:hypothetical protein
LSIIRNSPNEPAVERGIGAHCRPRVSGLSLLAANLPDLTPVPAAPGTTIQMFPQPSRTLGIERIRRQQGDFFPVLPTRFHH